MSKNQFNLSNLAGGAAGEQINMEVQKVYENICDPNTDKEKARKLTIVVTFKPDKIDGEVINVSVVSKATLQPINAIGTRMLIGRGSDGKAIANEWDKGIMKNQIVLEDGRTVDEDGEIHEEEPETERKIIDLKAR